MSLPEVRSLAERMVEQGALVALGEELDATGSHRRERGASIRVDRAQEAVLVPPPG